MTPVTLTFPADSANVALARSIAAAMAARADLPIDQLEDARLAVDEAVAQLLVAAPAGSPISCVYQVDGTRLDITVSGRWDAPDLPSTASFGWTVLSALCDRVDAGLADGRLTLSLTVQRAVAVDA